MHSHVAARSSISIDSDIFSCDERPASAFQSKVIDLRRSCVLYSAQYQIKANFLWKAMRLQGRRSNSNLSMFSLIKNIGTIPNPRPHNVRNLCALCGVRQLCLPMGLSESSISRLDKIVDRRRRVPRDAALYRMNDPFVNLYAVRQGHFKTSQIDTGGSQQITGFQMAADLLGMDAIDSNRHQCDAIALEDSEVCEIPFFELEELFLDVPLLLQHFQRMMSHEIFRERSVMLLLRHMRAERRLAAFLLNLSTRYAARGYSATSLLLPMTREEISLYLGLAIESVSRVISKFKQNGWLKVKGRQLELADPAALAAMANGLEPDCASASKLIGQAAIAKEAAERDALDESRTASAMVL